MTEPKLTFTLQTRDPATKTPHLLPRLVVPMEVGKAYRRSHSSETKDRLHALALDLSTLTASHVECYSPFGLEFSTEDWQALVPQEGQLVSVNDRAWRLK